MSKVAILTDSNSGITQEEAKQLGVFVFPTPVYINDEIFYEGVDLTTDTFFAKLGITTKVNHITSEEYARMYPDAARRPAYSNLDNYMLRLTTDQFAMAHWEDALDVYLKDLDVDAIE